MVLILFGVLVGDELGFYAIVGAILLLFVVSCYCGLKKPNIVEQYQDSFRKHGFVVEEVHYYSEFYIDGNFNSRRDRSSYIVFSEITPGREKLPGEGQWDFISMV